MLYFLILIFAGSSLFLLTTNLLSLLRAPRLHVSVDLAQGQIRKKKKALFAFSKLTRRLDPAFKPFYKLRYVQKLQQQLEVLKINKDMGVFIISKIFMSLVLGVLVYLIFPQAKGYIPAAVLAGFLIPDFILLQKIKAKKEKIVKDFPETIDLLDLCIGAGLDFTSAIKWVIEKTEENAFVEQLQTVLGEIKVGKSQTQALKDMSKRINLVDINSFARSVVQAENMGTSLEEAFRNLSEDTRLMRFQAGERYAIKASLKILIPLLFFILPVIMIVVAGPIIIRFSQGGLMTGGGAFGIGGK